MSRRSRTDPAMRRRSTRATSARRPTAARRSAVFALVRRLFAAPALAKYVVGETLPGEDVQTDDELLDYARQTGSTVFHATCTCKMGRTAWRWSTTGCVCTGSNGPAGDRRLGDAGGDLDQHQRADHHDRRKGRRDDPRRRPPRERRSRVRTSCSAREIISSEAWRGEPIPAGGAADATCAALSDDAVHAHLQQDLSALHAPNRSVRHQEVLRSNQTAPVSSGCMVPSDLWMVSFPIVLGVRDHDIERGGPVHDDTQAVRTFVSSFPT